MSEVGVGGGRNGWRGTKGKKEKKFSALLSTQVNSLLLSNNLWPKPRQNKTPPFKKEKQFKLDVTYCIYSKTKECQHNHTSNLKGNLLDNK